MNKVILLIIGMILFYSCSEPDEKKDYPVLKVSLESTAVSLDSVFCHLELIPLETNDSCLLIYPDKILCFDGKYGIFDSRYPALFVFDKHGRFIKRIGQKGNGPEEYTDIYDVILDSDGRNFCMLSPFGEILVYSQDGDFIERLRLPDKSNYQSFVSIKDCFVTWTLPSSEKEKGISLISKDSTCVIGEYWSGNRNLYFLYPRVFHKYSDKVYFFRPFSRKVYNISKDSMAVAYEWDFGKDNYSVNQFGFSNERSKENDEDNVIVKYLRNKKIPYLISLQQQNDKWYYVQLNFGFTPQGRSHIFYRKMDKKAFFFKEEVLKMKFEPLFWNNDFVMCLMNKSEIKSCQRMFSELDISYIDSMNDDENPLLVKFYFR